MQGKRFIGCSLSNMQVWPWSLQLIVVSQFRRATCHIAMNLYKLPFENVVLLALRDVKSCSEATTMGENLRYPRMVFSSPKKVLNSSLPHRSKQNKPTNH